jgi:tripartite-type tricarboxylate transporter receptor subunit TctC
MKKHHNPSRRTVLSTALWGTAAIASLPLNGFSQSQFPSKPITFVVPYPAGGANDMLGRLIGLKMSEVLGGTSVV